MYSRSAGVARSYRLPKKPDRELALRLRRGHRHVLGGHRALRRDIPGHLAVGLDEIGIAVGRPVQRVQRRGLELDTLAPGRGDQRQVGGLPVQPVDPHVAEQALGIALAGRQHGRQVRQAGADHDQRPAGLGELVARRAQRGHVGRRNVLHLVDEQRDPDPEVGRHRRGVGQQLGQVDLQVARIGAAADRGDVDAQLRDVPLGAAGRGPRRP